MLRSFPELTETFVFREIRALLARGVPVTVLAVTRGKGENLPGLAVHYLPPPIDLPAPLVWRDLSRLTGLRRKARAVRLAARARVAARLVPRDTAVLHAHFANDAGALARYTASLTGLPYRITAHAYDLYQDPFLLEENVRAAAHVFTVSEENLRWLRQRGDGSRISVLRCGLDLGEHPYRDPAPPGTPPRAVCVARLVEKKGHDVLLAAAARLPGLRLDLVGDGPRRSAIEAAAAKLAPALDVRVHGPLMPSATRDLVRGADVLVLAARVAGDGDRDGLPVALIEAAALGVPVVATALSGIPELVDPRTGHLVPPDDPRALAIALRASLEAPQGERVARARAARARVEADFDVDRLVEALVP
ncbi:MAG TPA: glycosyltransferase [Candidatus Polarisedimenticolaceae bacterium]|nr:glycosyltransferase [Candidatus Polarisedimenticolaceae bacterium]